MAASLISRFQETLLSELFGVKFIFFDAYSHAKDCFVAQFVIILLQSLSTHPQEKYQNLGLLKLNHA